MLRFFSLRRRLPRPSLSSSPEVPHRSVGGGAQVSSTYAPNKGAVAVPVSFGVFSDFFLKRDRNSGHITRPSQGSPGRRARNDPGCRRCLHSRYLHCERAFLSVRSTRCNPSANDPQLIFSRRWASRTFTWCCCRDLQNFVEVRLPRYLTRGKTARACGLGRSKRAHSTRRVVSKRFAA